MERLRKTLRKMRSFSALQRAEIAEISTPRYSANCSDGFSALQRAEIAEIIEIVQASC